MAESTGYQAYLERVRELHIESRDSLLQLLSALMTGATLDTRRQRCQATVRTLAILDGMFGKSHKPGWIQQLITAINQYAGTDASEEPARNVILAILNNHDAIFKRDILTDAIPPPIADFDAIYRESFDASQLPRLFDQLTELIETIIKSGAIDSARAIHTLQSLVDLLKQNRNGSAQAARSAFQVATAVARNVLWEYAENSSIGPMVKGVQKTLDEMGMSWRDLGVEILAKIQAKLPFDLKGIGTQRADRIAFHGEIIDGQATPADDHPRIANTPEEPEESAARRPA